MLDPLSDFGAFPSITKTEFNEQRQKEKDTDKTVDEKTKQMFEEVRLSVLHSFTRTKPGVVRQK